MEFSIRNTSVLATLAAGSSISAGEDVSFWLSYKHSNVLRGGNSNSQLRSDIKATLEKGNEILKSV